MKIIEKYSELNDDSEMPDDFKTAEVPKKEAVDTVLDDDEEDINIPSNTRTQGASILCGIVGLTCGGIVVGIFAAIGAAYASMKCSNGIGDAVRATGDVAVVAAHKAQVINKKHDVSGRTKALVNSGVEKARSLDKHHIIDKSGNAARSLVDNAKSFEQNNHVIDRTKKNLSNFFTFLAKKLNSGDKDNNTENEKIYFKEKSPDTDLRVN
mmetsp:Transcript_579/g.749  ORF Transcript_579/g.749 Transcript_579/m.749 type:complete len:210 (-) Transcript_579:165-794(-)